MARQVSIGRQDFEKLITSSAFYIDKTAFIREWWENLDEVTLITRPRRFGKTLNMSMLEQFFSVDYAGRCDLFRGLTIWDDVKYQKLQGTVPVIAFSFADIKAASFPLARKAICRNIRRLYRRYRFLLDTDCLDQYEKEEFAGISEEMEDYLLTDSIRALTEYLARYYGRKPIILLDEYDTPMHEAYVHGYWEKMVELMRGFFNATFKTNPYFDRAVMTGITRLSRESIFSDLNNLTVVTTTSAKYAASFGFTQDEVSAALTEFGLSDMKDLVKDWYDGFTFGSCTDIYNPWSIINFLDEKKPAAYWANTSSNSLVGKLIREGSRNVKIITEDLIAGKTFHTVIDEQIVFHQLEHNECAVWSLLLAGGYLKTERHSFHADTGQNEYDLKLTNKEVRLMFRNMIRDWFQNRLPAYNDFIRALLAGDLDEMNSYMNEIALKSFSYFDTESGAAEPERFYHGFVLGLITDLSDRYVITSNRESGYGRYDVMLEPKDSGDAIIIEFKVHRRGREKDLHDTVAAALAQIDEKHYTAALKSRGISPDRIRRYGFAFDGKNVQIGQPQ